MPAVGKEQLAVYESVLIPWAGVIAPSDMMPFARRDAVWHPSIFQKPAKVDTRVLEADEERKIIIRCAKDHVEAGQIVAIDPRHNCERASVDAHGGGVRTRIDPAAWDVIILVKVDCVLITGGSGNKLGQGGIEDGATMIVAGSIVDPARAQVIDCWIKDVPQGWAGLAKAWRHDAS